MPSKKSIDKELITKSYKPESPRQKYLARALCRLKKLFKGK